MKDRISTFVNREKLLIAMREKEITATALGKDLLLSRAAISAKMTGQRRFTEEEIYVLAQKFGTKIFNLR